MKKKYVEIINKKKKMRKSVKIKENGELDSKYVLQ